MKLKKLIKILKKEARENPELLNAKVLYSSDEDGTSFHKVTSTGTTGKYKKGEFQVGHISVNAICIN